MITLWVILTVNPVLVLPGLKNSDQGKCSARLRGEGDTVVHDTNFMQRPTQRRVPFNISREL